MKSPARNLLALLFGLSLLMLPGSLAAQIVPEPGPSMVTLTTPHFQVHYPRGQRALAVRTGLIAERVHAELEPKYQSGAENTHIVLVFSTDVVNAFATPLGLDQIVLFLDNPQSGTFSRYDLWAELLIRHEYTHIITLRHWGKRQPLLSVFRVLFGVPPNFLSPFGLIEGVAVYEESKTGRGRMRDPLTNMFIRTAVLENRFPSLAQILNGTHEWPFATLGYLYGGRFWQFISDTYGEKIIDRYWQSDNAPFSVNARLRPAPGLGRIFKDFRKAEYERFEAELADLRASGTTPFQRLTADGYSKSFLYVGSDGALKYFATPRNRIPGLFAIPADKLTSRAESPATSSAGFTGDSHADVLADPERVRRVANTRGFAEGGERRLYSETTVYLPSLGQRFEAYDGEWSVWLQRLMPGRSIRYPALSQDGSRAAYVERDEYQRRLVSATYTADGELQPGPVLAETPLTGMLQYAALSPDGSQVVALVRSGDQGEGELQICASDGSSACRVLVPGPGTKVQPRFTADGQSVLFASDVDGIYNLYSVEVNTGRVQRKTRSLTGVFYPAPAGDALYALGYFAEGFDVVRFRYGDLLSEPVDFFRAGAADRDTADGALDGLPGEDSYFDGLAAPGPDGQIAGLDAPGGPLPEGWSEGDYFAPFAIRPFLLGLFGPVSSVNVVAVARDPLFRHSLVAAIGAASPRPIGLAAYDYTRYALGLSLSYTTNYWKQKRQPGCFNDEDPLRFLCDSSHVFAEQARANLRYTSDNRFADWQLLAGYNHQKIRNARRNRAVEYDARDLNLSGPSATFLMGDLQAFPESISPEMGWTFFASTDYYTAPESTNRVSETVRNPIEYGVVEGGLSLYLPSFWDHHVNYLSGFGYGSYGPDRELQQVRLNRFVRGQEYAKSPSNFSAAVFTYEYRLPLVWWSEAIFGNKTGAVTLDGVGMSLFYDYGTVFNRKPYQAGWAGAYGLSIAFSFNLIYLNFPELKLTLARGTGPAGEGQVYLSFNAQFGSGPAVHDHDRNHGSPFTEPYRHGLMDRRANTGYWRDRWAGGIL